MRAASFTLPRRLKADAIRAITIFIAYMNKTGHLRGWPVLFDALTLLWGKHRTAACLAEVALQDREVVGVHYQVVIQVSRQITPQTELRLQGVEVGGIAQVVLARRRGNNVTTPQRARLEVVLHARV